MKEIELFFYGYTWEEYAFQISSLKGIFVIYKGRLDPEGFVDIKDVLYIGYHKGTFELYEHNIMGNIKQFLTSTDRIFLSYAEVSSDEIGYDVASLIVKTVHPKYTMNKCSYKSDYKLICKGYCKMIPDEILG